MTQQRITLRLRFLHQQVCNMAPKIALITGANGITGSAIAKYLCSHSTAEEWSKIIITSRSPLTVPFTDDRLEFIAMDFSLPAGQLVEQMQSRCSGVTHAYFSSYVHKDDFAELNAANEKLFENFLEALTQTSKALQNVTLQTGGKHYQVHLMPVPSPAREEEARVEAALPNFYFPQEDFLKAKAKQHGFQWNVIRPEAIIGCTHKPSKLLHAQSVVGSRWMLITSCTDFHRRRHERGAHDRHVLYRLCIPQARGGHANQPTVLGRS